jgi:hypothetical protein
MGLQNIHIFIDQKNTPFRPQGLPMEIVLKIYIFSSHMTRALSHADCDSEFVTKK